MSSALSFCPYKCICDDENLETSCIETSLEVMPMTLNPSMKTLILKHNNFHSVDASFNFYQELELVDLSSNHLVSIPDRAFSNQRNLVELRMNDNKISKLSENTFSGLVKLEVINLAENIIDRLPNKVFKSLKSLRELNLRGNTISEIQKRAFAGLGKLSLLDLSNNNLESIPTEALLHMTNLAELNLAKNNIQFIEAKSLFNSKLSFLDLSGNKIEGIDQNAFSLVKSIKQLNIQDNKLSEVPSKIFQSFDKLEILNIGQNSFRVIDDDAFLHLDRLNRLEISGCSNLQEVTENAFGILSDLEYVKISWNKNLNIIHAEAFGPLPMLKHFDLSNNGLSSVSPSLVPWMSLSSVDLSGNPWHCDCQNSFMKRVIINTVNNSDSIPIVRCWNPPNLRDSDIALLSMNCEIVQSPKTDQSVETIDSMAIVAVICSSAIVVCILLFFIIFKSRETLLSCLRSKKLEKGSDHLHTGKILHYQPYQEPRYVSHYPSVQTLKPVITPNPYQHPVIQQDQYFINVANQSAVNCHAEGDLMNFPVRQVRDNSCIDDDPHEERIYQSVSDPISEI